MAYNNKNMISEFFKPISKTIRAFSFSTYASKKMDPVSSSPNSIEFVNKAEAAAQKVFEEFFKENHPKQEEKSFFQIKCSQQEEAMKMDPFNILGL